MTHPELRLVATASALPPRTLGNDHFGDATGGSAAAGRMFLGTKWRRHIDRDVEAADLFADATRRLLDEQQLAADRVDTILTNVSLPDTPIMGCGAVVARRLGARPERVVDLHNGGCVSFILLMDLARSLMVSHGARRILVCVAQTAAGRIFGQDAIRRKPQSAVPGDGAAVALFGPEGTSVVGPIVQRCHPQYAEDMQITFDDGRKYWEATTEPGYLDFPESKISSIIMRGNRLVPEAMRELLRVSGLTARGIDALVTNQPNLYFLRNWREALELAPEQHFHTFEEYGNLFQAGIPVTLDHAIRAGRLSPGARVLLAGFSHAGDYSAAALLHYDVRSQTA